MTPLICSGFYLYYILRLNYLRKDINDRVNYGYKYNFKGKPKAPYSVKKTVLFIVIAAIVNIVLYIMYQDFAIVINVVPAICCLQSLHRTEKKIIQMDKED